MKGSYYGKNNNLITAINHQEISHQELYWNKRRNGSASNKDEDCGIGILFLHGFQFCFLGKPDTGYKSKTQSQ